MSVADTSLEAFLEKKESGTLTEDQELVFKVIKKHAPVTCKDVAIRLNKFPNEISGRFTELRKSGEIKIVGRKEGQRQYEVKE